MAFDLTIGSPFMPSLDQRDPGKGYTTDNVQVVVWVYNAAKQDWGHAPVVALANALCSEAALGTHQ